MTYNHGSTDTTVVMLVSVTKSDEQKEMAMLPYGTCYREGAAGNVFLAVNRRKGNGYRYHTFP